MGLNLKEQEEITMGEFTIAGAWSQRLEEDIKKTRSSEGSSFSPDKRSAFQRDKARVLHSAAFRRLQSKTQIHNNGLSDFYRTRLTHSLEVAQIGAGIVSHIEREQSQYRALLPDGDLIETICLSHDIGHPPFGHGGESSLNYMMVDHGGFEGNGQTFRIVTQLESYTQFNGMNLTRRSLLGLLKYPICLSQLTTSYPKKDTSTSRNFREVKTQEWTPAKGIYDHDKDFLNKVLSPLSKADKTRFQSTRTKNNTTNEHKKSLYKSIDCSIMEIADDIAYGVHDLEDAIAMGIIRKSLWQEKAQVQLQKIKGEILLGNLDTFTDNLFSKHHFERKNAIGALVNALITACSIKKISGFSELLLSYNAILETPRYNVLKVLKKFVMDYVINRPDLQILEYRGQQIVMELFEAFSACPLRFLPEPMKKSYASHKGNTSLEKRVIADYISSLTDNHALRLHANLFSSNQTVPMLSEYTI